MFHKIFYSLNKIEYIFIVYKEIRISSKYASIKYVSKWEINTRRAVEL